MNPSEVLIKEGDFRKWQKEVRAKAEGGSETGVGLLGVILSNRIYVVTRYVPSGPNSYSDSVTFETDENLVERYKVEEQKKTPAAKYLGDFHSHVFLGTPSPSSIDERTLKLNREKRSWFIIGVFSGNGELKVFGLDGEDSIVEVPYRLVPEDFDEEGLLARISEITDNDLLKTKRVAVLGGGSLASGAVSGLASTGIIDYIIVDMDRFSIVNVLRHIGGVRDLKKWKTKIVKDYIHSKQPYARVQTVEDDLIKNRKLLRAIIESSDIVVACSGSPEWNYHINAICVELKKPVVFAGIYDKAESAYVFYYSGKEESCCLDCIFDLTVAAVDQGAINRKYGMTSDELRGRQGHWADIAIPGLMMSKMTLNLLLGKEMSYNLIRYYDSNSVKRYNAPRKEFCATCNYENWLKREEQRQDLENEKSILKKAWRIFLKKMTALTA